MEDKQQEEYELLGLSLSERLQNLLDRHKPMINHGKNNRTVTIGDLEIILYNHSDVIEINGVQFNESEIVGLTKLKEM